MQVIKNASDWAILCKCTGVGFDNRHKPCGSQVMVEKSDIVRLESTVNGETKITYGFICMNCNCFTQINAFFLPHDILLKCPTIAKKGTVAYSKLSVEEQVLSDKL
jgi:hypothetical protein